MKVVRGDLLDLARRGQFDVVVHGCNCFCNFGKGIALQVKREFPAAFRADLQTAKGDRTKMGSCSQAEVQLGHGTLVVVNAYTQYHWNGPGILADYPSIRRCMAWIRETHPHQRIGLPRIGAGLAGGDWPTIAAIIDEELGMADVTLVEFEPLTPRGR
jgi:O-acetyl-ADP-ribose deacetylase (regulator of RNase III)